MRIASHLLVGIDLAFLFCGLSAQTVGWQPPRGHTQTPIWPSTPPDARPITGPESFATNTTDLVAGKPWVHVDNVSRPTMTVFPPQGRNTGAAVVVFPGGGYWLLAIHLEGTAVCDWLASRGITAVLLKYRVPGEGKLPKSGAYPKSPEALQDAQRVIGLVRLRASTAENFRQRWIFLKPSISRAGLRPVAGLTRS